MDSRARGDVRKTDDWRTAHTPKSTSSLTSLESNKPISLRVAHFAQFKGGRLSNIRVLVDSFDLVEQALGHAIHLPRMTA